MHVDKLIGVEIQKSAKYKPRLILVLLLIQYSQGCVRFGSQPPCGGVHRDVEVPSLWPSHINIAHASMPLPSRR